MKILLISIFFINMTFITAQEVGLQLYSLRNQFKNDVPNTLKMVHDWGIKYIEGGDTYGLPLEEFKELLYKNELKMVGVGASYEDLQDNLNKVIQTANNYEAKFIMVPWIPHDGNKFGFNEIKQATDLFNKTGKLLKKEGLELTYHPHGYEFRPYENGTLFDYMATNAKYFTFELDIFWAKQGGGDPLAILKKYPNKISLLHLKDRALGTISDNTGQIADETNVVLGSGDVGIKDIVKEAKKIGVKFMFIEDESPDVIRQIPKSLEYLNGLD